MLWHLNNWYGQQSNYVNTMYVNIVRGCTDKSSTNKRPAPDGIKGTEENVAINEDEIEDLTAGIDEDKVVRITIPKNPTGFRPRN